MNSDGGFGLHLFTLSHEGQPDQKLGGGDVFGLKALGALLDLKLHRLPFRQRLVSIHLNRGEMDEDVLSRLALNEPIAFCCVEPLDHTLFSAQLSTPRSERSQLPGCNASRWRKRNCREVLRTTTGLPSHKCGAMLA